MKRTNQSVGNERIEIAQIAKGRRVTSVEDLDTIVSTTTMTVIAVNAKNIRKKENVKAGADHIARKAMVQGAIGEGENIGILKVEDIAVTRGVSAGLGRLEITVAMVGITTAVEGTEVQVGAAAVAVVGIETAIKPGIPRVIVGEDLVTTNQALIPRQMKSRRSCQV